MAIASYMTVLAEYVSYLPWLSISIPLNSLWTVWISRSQAALMRLELGVLKTKSQWCWQKKTRDECHQLPPAPSSVRWSAPTKFVPLSYLICPTSPLSTKKHRKQFINESVDISLSSSIWTAWLAIQVKMAPYFFSVFLPFTTWKGQKDHILQNYRAGSPLFYLSIYRTYFSSLRSSHLSAGDTVVNNRCCYLAQIGYPEASTSDCRHSKSTPLTHSFPLHQD